MVSSSRKKTARNARRKKVASTAIEIMEVGEDAVPSVKKETSSPKAAPKKPKKAPAKTKPAGKKAPEPDVEESYEPESYEEEAYEEAYEPEQYEEEWYEAPEPDVEPITYTFGFGDGEKTIIGENAKGILEITDIGSPLYSLADWNVIISKTDIIPLSGRTGDTIDFPKGMTRGVLLSEDGYRADFCNAEKITIPNPEDAEPKDAKNHLFLTGDLGKNGDDAWGLVVTGCKTLNLAKITDFSLALNPEEIGVLSGPQGNILHFSNIAEVKLPVTKDITEDFITYNLQETLEEVPSATGNKQELFYFSANDDSAEFAGTPDRSIIRIETDTTYGWNVSFANGILMSLQDLKEFQSRHGKLPDNTGKIMHGDQTLRFTGATAILIYEPPTYSSFDLE